MCSATGRCAPLEGDKERGEADNDLGEKRTSASSLGSGDRDHASGALGVGRATNPRDLHDGVPPTRDKPGDEVDETIAT